MTLANKITIIRILLVPLCIVQIHYYADTGLELHRYVALSCFALAVFSDALDGYIARRYNQRSELGAVLDPMADKLLLVLSLVMLTVDNRPHLSRIPFWLTATVLSRDVILTFGLAVIHYTCGKFKVRPCFTGKVATVLQMICIFWVLLKWDETLLYYWALAAAICTALSGLYYITDGIRQLSASPSSAAAKDQSDF